MNKRSLIALVFLLGIVGFFAYTIVLNRASPVPLTVVSDMGTSNSSTATNTDTVTEAVRTRPARASVIIKVDSATYTVPFTSGDTALDAMQLATKDGFAYSGNNYTGLGFFVESVQGRKNADGYYWILYLNGATSTLGVSDLKIKQSDNIEWRYEKSY